MPAPRILLVKLSSLGDVVHLFPALTDLAAHRGDANVLWAVEDAYAGLVRLHPAVTQAIAVPLRALRDHPLSPSAWRSVRRARKALRSERCDYVVDAQGLIKSAWVSRWARAPIFGPDRASAREGLAARLYDVPLPVARNMHAVARNRTLVGKVFGYSPAGPARYGITRPSEPPPWAPAGRYAVLLHAASRRDKRWKDDHWVALARRLASDGCTPVFPGGSERERSDAARMASAVGNGALAAPAMTLVEAAALLAHAQRVVGVDTGLSHLAVALGVSTVGIYCATSPQLTGLHGEHGTNLGGRGAAPELEEVARAVGLGAEPA